MNDKKKKEENLTLIKNFLAEVKAVIAMLKVEIEPAGAVELEEEVVVDENAATAETKLETEEVKVPETAAATAAAAETALVTVEEIEEVVEEVVVEAAATEEVVVDDAAAATVEVPVTELAIENFNIQALADQLDLNLDGSYSISFSLKKGIVIWGELSAYTYATLLSNETKDDKAKIELLTKTISESEAKLTALLGDTGSGEFIEPINGKEKISEKTVGETRVDMKKEEMREKRKKQ